MQTRDTNRPARFVEEEPIRLAAVPDQPDTSRPGRVVDLDAQVVRDQARRLAGLPPTGPGVIRVVPIGGRIVLQPSDQRAAVALQQARAQLGAHWDQKRTTHIYHLDEFLKRGVIGFDSLNLAATMCGLTLEVPASAQATVARYRRRLERQLRPIPRHTWVDDEGSVETTVTGETNLGGGGYRRWRRS